MVIPRSARPAVLESQDGGSRRAFVSRSPGVLRVLTILVTGLCLISLVTLAGCQEPVPEPDVPAGSLRLLAEAAQKGEWGTMLVYMDPIEIGTTFAQSTISRLDDEIDPDAPAGGSGSHNGGAFAASPMVTGFTESFQANFRSSVEHGTVLAEGNLLRVILDEGVGETEFVSETEATVTVEMPGDDAEPVLLRMVRDADHWKLVSIEGTTDIYSLLF